MRYLLVDTANTFFRARHSAHRQSDTWDKLGFAIHVTLASINKAYRDQRADHVIFCLEGRSWRKDFYEPYKKNRSVARAALTESEAEEAGLFDCAPPSKGGGDEEEKGAPMCCAHPTLPGVRLFGAHPTRSRAASAGAVVERRDSRRETRL